VPLVQLPVDGWIVIPLVFLPKNTPWEYNPNTTIKMGKFIKFLYVAYGLPSSIFLKISAKEAQNLPKT
jgi:hypothetical protein